MNRRKWRFNPRAQIPKIDDAEYAGAIDRLRTGLLDIERYGKPRHDLTVSHPHLLMEIQQNLDAELAMLAERAKRRLS